MYSYRALIKTHQREFFVVLLSIIAYLPTILWMSERWFAENSYYSHGVLVPLVTLFLIYRKRDLLERMEPSPSPWGFRLFLLGIILYWISALLRVYFTSGFSLLIIISGLVLHFYGEKILKEIRFPLLFLVFMVPMPIIVVAYVCFKLKIMAAFIATAILNIVGLHAIQQTSLIRLEHTYVLVEDSCGGLRSLISLTALGSIFAYQLRSSPFKKTMLFFSAIPIAVISNACRIVFLSAVGELWGPEHTRGLLHSISAYMVFAFAFLMLYAVKRFLEHSDGQS